MDYKDIYIYTNSLNDIANAIRNRDGISGVKFYPQNMDDAIYEYIKLDGLWLGDYGGVIQEYTGQSFIEAYRDNTNDIYQAIVTNKTYEGNMDRAFERCYNLLIPGCAFNIKNAIYAYNGCRNLIGPANMGLKRTQKVLIGHRVDGSPNYIDSTLLVNATHMYANCVNLRGDPVFGGTRTRYLQYAYNNCINLDGTNLYIPAYNIDMNVELVGGSYQYTPNYYTKNLYSTLRNCVNFKGNLDRNDPNVFNEWLQVENFDSTFADCHSLTGEPIAFNGPYISMYATYINCWNLTGNGCCGLNTTDMIGTFKNCINLNGYGVSGPNVINMINTYYNCTNLSAGEIGPNTVVINHAFYNCRNLRGTIFINNVITDGDNAFAECRNLGGVYISGSQTAANCKNMFNVGQRDQRLNIVFVAKSTMSALRASSVTGCTMSSIETSPITVRLPLASYDGSIIGYREFSPQTWCYNTAYNIYMYALSNV